MNRSASCQSDGRSTSRQIPLLESNAKSEWCVEDSRSLRFITGQVNIIHDLLSCSVLGWVHTFNVTAYRNTVSWRCGQDSCSRNVSRVGYAIMLRAFFGVLSVFGRRIKGMIRLRPEQVWTCNVTVTLNLDPKANCCELVNQSLQVLWQNLEICRDCYLQSFC